MLLNIKKNNPLWGLRVWGGGPVGPGLIWVETDGGTSRRVISEKKARSVERPVRWVNAGPGDMGSLLSFAILRGLLDVVTSLVTPVGSPLWS